MQNIWKLELFKIPSVSCKKVKTNATKSLCCDEKHFNKTRLAFLTDLIQKVQKHFTISIISPDRKHLLLGN